MTFRRVAVLVLFASAGSAFARHAHAQTPMPVVWVDPVHVTTTGPNNNGLQKTGGLESMPDAGAYSQQAINVNGYLEFTAPATNAELYVGLTPGPGSGLSGSFPWTIHLSSIGIAEVRENGVYRAEWSYVANDRFRITLTNGTVTYTHNDTQPYVSNQTSTAPVTADTLFMSVGGAITNALIAGAATSDVQPVDWTGFSHVQEIGPNNNGLRKTSGFDATPDAGAYSQQSIASGDAYLQFKATNTTTDAVIGLTTGDGTGTSGIFPWSIHLSAVGIAEVRENGAYKAETAYAGGDTFRISIAGGAVTYRHNASTFYTSQQPATYPLKIDASISTLDGQFEDALISAGAVENGGGAGAVPVSYQVITHRDPKPKPASPPALPAAGSWYSDDNAAAVSSNDRFGLPGFPVIVRRITDRNPLGTSPVDDSYHTPSALMQTAWASDSSRFYVMSNGGTVHVFTLHDGAPVYDRQLDWTLEPAFSRVAPNLMFGTRNTRTHVIEQYDFNHPAGTSGYTTLLDLKTIDTTLTTSVFTHSIYISAAPNERIIVKYGGSSQDADDRILIFDRNNPGNWRLIDTTDSTIRTPGGTAATNIPLGFTMHAAWLDQSGRFAVLYPQDTGDCDQYVYDWDTNSLSLMNLTSCGHDTLGFGVRINQDSKCVPRCDAAQWQVRSLLTPATTEDRINPLVDPKMVYEGDHTSWHNARPDVAAPVFSALSRRWDSPWAGPGGIFNDVEWRPWDDEIVAFTSTGPTTVWRFAHHWSNVASDDGSIGSPFYYGPHPQISPNGRWVIFTSNWNKSLGVDAAQTPERRFRVDVFLLKLPVQ